VYVLYIVVWPFVLFLLTIVCPFSLEKKDKQWPREKGQTMVKRKRTNNGQEKKDKHLLAIVLSVNLQITISYSSGIYKPFLQYYHLYGIHDNKLK
jgi:hypothetical protein